MITIYRKTDAIETTVCTVVNDKAAHVNALMSKDEVMVDVTTDSILPVQVLDYIYYDGMVYTLNREPEVDKRSEVEYHYALVFESPRYTLYDKAFTYPLTRATRFTLTGTLRDFVELLVTNANEIDPGWRVGEVPDKEFKNITFESITCRDVLDTLAAEFSVEYHIPGKQVNFYDRYERVTTHVFEQGKGKGLYTLSRQNVDSDNTVTRAILYGGTKNLPLGYRDGSEYLRWSDPQGNYYVENFSEYRKIVERDVYFDDVYPRFNGAADSVAGEFNEKVRCAAIDFDINDHLIGGVEAKINFVTGDLTGRSFSLQYNHTLREVTLIRMEDETALPDAEGKRPMIPSATLRPRVGDKINFTDILLPEPYVKAAEQELHDKGTEWLNIYSQLRQKFTLDVDHRYLRSTGKTLAVGDIIRIVDRGLAVDKLLRIISTERNLATGKLSCEVSNYPRYSWEKEIEGKIQAAKDRVEIIRSEVLYDINASRAWVGRNFARLNGGNRMTGIQQLETLIAELTQADKVVADLIESDLTRSEMVEFATLQTDDFTPGPLGAGIGTLNKDEIQTDRLLVRKELTVLELIIQKMRHQGGQTILSPAGFRISAVVDGGSYWRCFFENDGGNIPNEFVADDQARINNYTGGDQKYLWALVTSVGEDYVNLSKTDKDGEGIPVAGDHLVQLGHRSNTDRQDAVVISAVGGEVGIVTYHGIDSFSMSGKEGSWFGKHGGEKGAVVKGKFIMESGKTVQEYIDEAGTALQTNVETRLSAIDGEISASVKKEVSNIQIGGVNLLPNSAAERTSGFEYIDYVDLTALLNAGTLKVGETYTISADVKLSSPGACNMYVLGIAAETFNTNKTAMLSTEYQRMYITGQFTHVEAQNVLSFYAGYGTGLIPFVRRVKIETGNMPTAWTLAEEERATKAELSAEISLLPDKISLAVKSIQLVGGNYVQNSDVFITTGQKDFDMGAFEEWQGKTVVVSCDIEVVGASGGRLGFEPVFFFSDGEMMSLACWLYPANYPGGNFKGRISATYSIPDKKISSFLQRGIYVQTTGTLVKVGRPQIILGNVDVAWSAATQDLPNALAECGIEITAKKLILKGNTEIYDPAGNLVALFENGKIRAAHIDVDSLIARKLVTDNATGGVTIIDSVVVHDEDGEAAISMSNGNLPALATLTGTASSSSVNLSGGSWRETTTALVGQFTLVENVTTIVTVHIPWVTAEAIGTASKLVRAEVGIYLEGPGIRIPLGSGFAVDGGGFVSGGAPANYTQFAVDASHSFTPSARITLLLKADITVTAGGGGYVDIGAGTIALKTQVNNIAYLCKNGIAAVYGNERLMYMAASGNGDTFFALKGKTDIPGVLAAGSVASGGSYSGKWGAKLLSGNGVGKQGTGWYRLNHNIGHTEYFVTVTPAYSTTPCIAQIYAKATTYVDIYITNYSGTFRDSNFDFSINGNN